MKSYLIWAASVIFVMSACAEAEEETESTEESATTEEPAGNSDRPSTIEEVVEMSDEDESEDLMSQIVGEWEYVESITTVGTESMTMRAANDWVMIYKEDGTFEESQQIVEGGEHYTAEGGFSIESKTLKREGLLQVEIKSLSDSELLIDNAGSTMKFKRK